MPNSPIRLSFQLKVALGSLMAVLLVWSGLAALSLTATNTLIDVTSQRLYSSNSNELALQVKATYEPLIVNTAILAEHSLSSYQTYEERMQSVPLLLSILNQSDAVSAILAGYDNGDHFMVRTLPTDVSRTQLNAPADAHYAVDHLYGDRREVPFRRFYDEQFSLLLERSLPDYAFDPRVRPWYITAQASEHVITTDPYVFFSSREMGMTIAKRSSDSNAVVAMDVALSTVSSYLARQRITDNTDVVLRNNDGFIAWSGGQPVIETPTGIRQRQLGDIDRQPFQSLAEGELPEDWLIHQENVESVLGGDLAMLIAVPKDEFLVELRQVRDRILLYSFIILVLLVPLAWWMSSRLAGPIRELHRAISNVDKATFALELPPVRSNDEIGALNRALLAMSEALQHYIEDLEVATAAKQKLESEMEIARRIQMELVPGGGEHQESLRSDDIYARLIPARAVGGDLYDVLKLNDGRYFIAVGDVSGKGMPAALFMSRAVALTKLIAPTVSSAGEFLSLLNEELVRNNDSCMFITLFCGFYDARSGSFQCACAGHNPPIILRQGSADFLELEAACALGVFEESDFPNQTIELTSGEEICIYTDGITEAFNEAKEEFTDQRLMDLLSGDQRPLSAQERAKTVLQAVEQFSDGCPQSDDITLVVLRRH